MSKQDDLIKMGLAIGGIYLLSRYTGGAANAYAATGPSAPVIQTPGTSGAIATAIRATGQVISSLPSSGSVSVTSDVVAWVQQSLNFLLDTSISVDGQFGPQTQSLVTTYQGIKGLYASGRIDQPTIDAINGDLASSESLSWGRYPTLQEFMQAS